MARASITIFANTLDYDKSADVPSVPESVFEAAQRVIETKGCELIKARDGMYVVKYSPTGPFSQSVSDEWLPVYVARIETWSSGGIRKNEYDNFVNSGNQAE